MEGSSQEAQEGSIHGEELEVEEEGVGTTQNHSAMMKSKAQEQQATHPRTWEEIAVEQVSDTVDCHLQKPQGYGQSLATTSLSFHLATILAGVFATTLACHGKVCSLVMLPLSADIAIGNEAADVPLATRAITLPGRTASLLF